VLAIVAAPWLLRSPSESGAPGTRQAPVETSTRPSLAVLPFTDMSQGRDHEYLARVRGGGLRLELTWR